MNPRWIVLAGLPGAGKSALARALAARTGARVFDKDEYRARLFGAEDRAGAEQNERAMAALLADVARHLVDAPARAIVDGRTFTRRAHVDAVVEFARGIGAAPAWVRVHVAAEVARARLSADARAGRHPAPDRDETLYERVAAREEPLLVPHVAIDGASGTPEELAARVLAALGCG